jgi:hypothetical protein
MSQETNELTFYTKLVYIEWQDAVAVSDWEEVREAELFKCKTVGFVVAESDSAICVAAVVSDEDKQSNSKIHIPKAWVDKIIRFPLSRIIDSPVKEEINPDLFKLSPSGSI